MRAGWQVSNLGVLGYMLGGAARGVLVCVWGQCCIPAAKGEMRRRGAAWKEEEASPETVLMSVACSPDRTSRKLEQDLPEVSAGWPGGICRHLTEGYAVPGCTWCDLPTEALGLISFQTPQLLPPSLMLPKNGKVWPVEQSWCVQAGMRKDALYFPRTVY